MICPRGTFCSALWGVPLHKPVGALSAAAWCVAVADTETLTSNVLGLEMPSKHVFPLCLLSSTHCPPMSCFWTWDGDDSGWSPEHVPKSHGAYKVDYCLRNLLGDVQHPCRLTRMLRLRVLWWWPVATLLPPPDPREPLEAARHVQGSAATGLTPFICLKILTHYWKWSSEEDTQLSFYDIWRKINVTKGSNDFNNSLELEKLHICNCIAE